MSLFHHIRQSFTSAQFGLRGSLAARNVFRNCKTPICRSFHKIGNDDPLILNLKLKKKLFTFTLFTSTGVLAWTLHKRKSNQRNELMKDCTRVPLEEELFNVKLSFYKYKGFVFPNQILLPGLLKDLKDFQFRNTDVVVASFPKSGTTMVQEIVYMLLHDCQESDASSEFLETRFPYLEYPYPGVKDINSKSGRRFLKTHLPLSVMPESFADSGAKLIYVIRNPRDVATSYYHFMRLLTSVDFLGNFQEFVDLFLSDKVPYGPYFSHLKSYVQAKDKSNVLIINFEDLKTNPSEMIQKIANFLEIPVSNEDILQVAKATNFSSMVENPSVNYQHWKDYGFAFKDGRFLRKGIVGDWKNHFSSSMKEQFELWEKENIDPSLKFNYE